MASKVAMLSFRGSTQLICWSFGRAFLGEVCGCRPWRDVGALLVKWALICRVFLDRTSNQLAVELKLPLCLELVVLDAGLCVGVLPPATMQLEPVLGGGG